MSTGATTKRIQRNLTIMFTDISGFTKHTEKISRDQLMNRLDTHNKLLMPIVAHFEGKVIKTIGDAFLITFESPTNAVQCGTYMQYTLRKYNQGLADADQIHIKISINSGEVTVTDNDVFGDPVNVAAKIEKATNPDEIYFTENVFLAMNKAEVPNAFVKTFRPRGENSNEIKLYKVVQDEHDEAYKRIVEQTKIDPEKMKTRIIELSATAEKEYTRYQEALEALMEGQAKSSKTTVLVMAVGVLVLAAVLLAGFFILKDKGPTAEQVAMEDARVLMANGKAGEAVRSLEAYIKEHGESAELKDLLELAKVREKNDAEEKARTESQSRENQTLKDARDYLKQGRSKEARALVEKYIQQNGKSKAMDEMLLEISEREFLDVEDEVNRLIAQGRPDTAKALIDGAAVEERFKKRADALKQIIKHYLAARAYVDSAESEKALAEIEAAFGQTNPGTDVESLRAKATATGRALKLMAAEDAKENGPAAINILTKAFGDVMPPAVLEIACRAIELELSSNARREGKEAAIRQLEAYRARFGINGSVIKHMTREIRINGLWYFTTTETLRHKEILRVQTSEKFFPEIWALQKEEAKDAEFLWRLADTLWDISKASWRVPIGTDLWGLAYVADNKIVERHPEVYEKMLAYLEYTQDSGVSDDMREKGITEPVFDCRFFIKKYWFKKARPALIEGLTAQRKSGNKMEPNKTLQANCFAVLADMGEAGLVKNRYEFFRDVLIEESLRDRTIDPEHVGKLFVEEMTFEEYGMYRQLIEETRQETKNGRWSAYSLAPPVVDRWLELLKEVQPLHTASYK